MTAISKPRAIAWIERSVLSLAVLFLCIHSLPRAWRTLNTDFPNYYMAVRLVHEGYDTSRMYEWSWIEREKDHRGVDIRVIGLLPITPFSTLAILPLTELKPLAAKHVWILLNLAFLLPIAWMLQLMIGVSYRHIGLAIFLSFPMYRNLQYGQFYILLLLLLTAACFSYLRGYRALSGVLLAIAAACKVFPLLLLIFFLQRRDWRALASAMITGLSTVAVSIAIFGISANRTWLQEILPWVMHGEGLGTYTTTASISGILHCLFLSEPQWNPHPWHASTAMYAMLAPALQMLVLVPAILLIRRGDESQCQILLEWSSLLTVALAISTIPASYNFVLMVFPVCVLSSILLRDGRYGWLSALIIAYLGIGFPFPVPNGPLGLALLLYVPRLPLMVAVLFGTYALLWRHSSNRSVPRDWSRYAWATVMVAFAIFSMRSTLHLERAEREEYAYRLPLQAQGFLNSDPESTTDGVRYTAFTLTGYHLITEGLNGVQVDQSPDLADDDLSFSCGFGHTLVERASDLRSRIVDLQNPSTLVDNAREPMLSADGRDLAFLQGDHGRGRLMFRPAFRSSTVEMRLTPLRLNVYEASFLSEREYAVSAVENGAPPKIVLTDAKRQNMPIIIAESRYPALSPDGQWLAFSHLDHGVWNLWLRDENSGLTRRIGNVPCNEIQPSWESDSKTLLYGTDCGRSVWFTAVARRKVLP